MPWQSADWLAMTVLGTNGGDPLVDGSAMPAGAHLRWQLGRRLGFPPGGFDVYRRLHIPGAPECQTFAEWLPVGAPPYAVGAWLLTPSPGTTVKDPPPVCDGNGALRLAGAGRSLLLVPPAPARTVQISFSGAMAVAPLVTALRVEDGTELTLMSVVAVPDGAGHLVADLQGDRIDRVRVDGADIVVCRMCYVDANADLTTGWGAPLNGVNPIHLPITNSAWPGYHANTPNDAAEAAARLPPGLPGPVAGAYNTGFVDELRDLLDTLVSTSPQHEIYQVQPGVSDPGPNVRAQPSLRYSVLDLVTLAAVDPNIARILGLYWQDATAVAGTIYDYLVVGHWGAELYPATYYDYEDETVGRSWSLGFAVDGVTYQCPRAVSVVSGTWGGTGVVELAFGTAAATWTPGRIQLPDGTVQVVHLDVDMTAVGTVRAYRSGAAVATVAVAVGQSTVTVVNAGGIDQLLVDTMAPWKLYRVYTRPVSGAVGDVNYVSWHALVGPPPAVPVPALQPLSVVSVPSRLAADGSPTTASSAVGLRWPTITNPPTSETRRPVRFQVQRDDRGNGGGPGPVTATHDLTREYAVTHSPPEASGTRPASWPPMPQDFVDWDVAPGWYDYRVRAVDIFGRASVFSGPQTIRALGLRQPPPPAAVAARWLDAADPWISTADAALLAAASATQAIRVDFTWSGWNRLQAPGVETAGEFLVYFIPGEANGILGRITATSPLGGTTELTTDQEWTGAADALAGEFLRVGGRTFEITGNTTGAAAVLTVQDLTDPDEQPTTGPFVVRFSRTGPNFLPLSPELAWTRRIHAESAVPDGPWLGTVTAVTAVAEGWEVVTDIDFSSAAAELVPGVAWSAGVTWRAKSQDMDASSLLVLVLDARTMGDDTDVVPAVGDTLRYTPGRRYTVLVTSETLAPADDYPVATGLVGVAASDGDAAVPDDAAWASVDRGGLGGRAGNKGRVSVPCRVTATRTTAPSAPTATTASASTPVYADPADWYGMARYTLSWWAVTGAGAYHVYRSTAASLFLRDREMRRLALGPYGSDPFPDESTYGYDADAWLTENYPTLTRAGLQSPDLRTDPDGDTILAAWRAFAEWFYPQLDDLQVQQLADTSGNEQAFRRINAEPVDALSYEDRFEARGRGFVLYRVRAQDDSGNESAWGATHPPVHIRRVDPPRMPRVLSVTAEENAITFTWTAIDDPDLQDYLLWRGSDAASLADVRWEPEPEVVTPAATGPTESYTDDGLVGGTDVYYRLAARDTFGNVSQATPVFAGRAIDTTPPESPEWEAVEWRKIRGSDGALLAWSETEDPADTYTPVVCLRCLAEEAGLEFVVERKASDGLFWTRVGTWTEADDTSDPEAEDARRFTTQDSSADTGTAYSYRVRVRDGAGNVNRSRFQTYSLAAP